MTLSPAQERLLGTLAEWSDTWHADPSQNDEWRLLKGRELRSALLLSALNLAEVRYSGHGREARITDEGLRLCATMGD